MTASVTQFPEPSPSRSIAGEIRAEMARQGVSQAALAAQLHVGQPWLSRRIGLKAEVDMTFEDVATIAKALSVSAQRLASVAFTSEEVTLLPRLDSNQQPSDYPSAQVIDLDTYRAEREKVSA